MSDMPERIWAASEWKRIDQGKWWDCNPGGDATEYLRADLVPAAPKVNALVEAAKAVEGAHIGTVDYDRSMDALRAALAALEGGDA